MYINNFISPTKFHLSHLWRIVIQLSQIIITLFQLWWIVMWRIVTLPLKQYILKLDFDTPMLNFSNVLYIFNHFHMVLECTCEKATRMEGDVPWLEVWNSGRTCTKWKAFNKTSVCLGFNLGQIEDIVQVEKWQRSLHTYEPVSLGQVFCYLILKVLTEVS